MRYQRDKERILDQVRQYRLQNGQSIKKQRWAYHGTPAGMLSRARRRAKDGGYPCTITTEDIVIPKRCPLLGMQLERASGGVGPNSPSLDKLVPALGYVPGNVIVISHRANSIKQDATLQELKDLTKNLEKILSERTHTWKDQTHEESSH